MAQGKTASTSKSGETLAKVLVIPELGVAEFADLIRLILEVRNVTTNATISIEPLKRELADSLAAAERDPPDLIILITLNSPLIFSDEECYRFRASRASSALRDIPILFMGHVAKNPEKEARRFGANGYVTIPLDIQEFLTAYDAMLNGEPYYPPLPEESRVNQ
jgi:CheY-like chemotaxis protein